MYSCQNGKGMEAMGGTAKFYNFCTTQAAKKGKEGPKAHPHSTSILPFPYTYPYPFWLQAHVYVFSPFC